MNTIITITIDNGDTERVIRVPVNDSEIDNIANIEEYIEIDLLKRNFEIIGITE